MIESVTCECNLIYIVIQKRADNQANKKSVFITAIIQNIKELQKNIFENDDIKELISNIALQINPECIIYEGELVSPQDFWSFTNALIG